MNTTANLQQNFENIQLEFDPNKVLFSPNNEGVIVYEEFKDIPGYEGMYQVSNFGRAKSLNRMIKHYKGGESSLVGKVFRQHLNNYGYYVIGLRKVKETKIRLHQLVAMTFLGHKPCGHKVVVDHKDNIRTNNFFWNLQLISQRENSSKDKKGYSSDCTGVSRCAETKNFTNK